MDASSGSWFSTGNDESGHFYGSRYQASRRLYRRHSAQQVARLEEAFRICPHPDERARLELSMELGLEPRQVKFWFQNRRTQEKNQNERIDNSSLRSENEKMHAENFIIREALKNILCLSCGSPTLPDEQEQSQVRMQKLLMENAYLKQQYEKVQQLLANYNVISGSNAMLEQNVAPVLSPTTASNNLLNPQIDEIPSLSQRFHDLLQNITSTTTTTPFALAQVGSAHGDQQINSSIPSPAATVDDFASLIGNIADSEERGKLEKVASDAVEELTRLLRMNEPFWFRSTVDGKFMFQRESYDKMFQKGKRLKGQRSRRESSKDSRLVFMSGPQLVDTLLDSGKWVGMFPTIVRRAYTLEVVENGMAESRSGALHLMYGEMHILSPMVPSREFYFLRSCVQVDVGAWVIADVSFNSSKFSTKTSAWRLPSGCLIQDMNDGSSRVTWVEHVEVNDKFQNHQILKELVCEGNAFGAERWVLTLERMCERVAFASMQQIPSSDAGGVITLGEGRRSVMQLAERMVRLFCRALSDETEIPYVRMDNCGVRVSVRNVIAEGEPNGIIVCAATSFSLPLSPLSVFQYLKHPSTRHQWDVLCHGNPVSQIQHISNGSHPDNCTSFFQPNIPDDNNMMLLQESCVDKLGCMMVYAPVDVTTISAAMAGEDTSTLPILPTGITIAGAGGGGSIVTVVIQVLLCSQSSMDPELYLMESVTSINALATSTVENIKLALGCSESL